jgi:hypothetical protein
VFFLAKTGFQFGDMVSTQEINRFLEKDEKSGLDGLSVRAQLIVSQSDILILVFGNHE